MTVHQQCLKHNIYYIARTVRLDLHNVRFDQQYFDNL